MSSIFNLLNTAQNSLEAQREAMDVAVENVANSLTPGYKAKQVVFSAKSSEGSFSDVLSTMQSTDRDGVTSLLMGDDLGMGSKVAQIYEDQSQGVMVYNPNHPNANANGYVEMSNVDNTQEMINMTNSIRQMKANLAIVEMAKKAAQEALQMTRNA